VSDPFNIQEEKNQPQGFNLDFKRVLARAIRFWYVIILSLSVALAIAFYKNRYTQRTYPISTSIVIREMQETAGGEFLYKNSLLDGYRNYLNEPYIIRSYPLIEKVIKELSFHVAFYREGYFMTTEAYDYVPVKASWCSEKDFKSGQFLFTLKDETHFTLSKFSKKESEQEQHYVIGDSIMVDGYSLCIRRIPERSIKSYIGIPFLMNISNPTSVAGSYISRLKVEWAEEGAGIINLNITGTAPSKEIDFLNELVKVYGERDLEKKNETAERTIQFIQKELIKIKDSLRSVEFQLERFGNSSRVKDMSADAQRLFAKTEAFELQQTELLIRRNYYEYLDEYLAKNNANLDQIILPSSVGIADPVITSLLTRMVDQQLEMKLLIDPGKNGNPLVTSKLERIKEIRRDIIEAINTLRSTDKIKFDFIKKQLDQIDKQLVLLPASERQLIAVQRNYSLLENLYVFLMQKLSEAGISRASNTSDIIPVNPPMKGGAISPNPKQNYSLALIIGFIVPALVFIFFELINNKIQSKEDIDKVTSIPFIGGVGHNAGQSNLTVKDKPKSGLAESFRALRSNLNFFTGNQIKKVFMVSSSISGEGKTFTTINLATVFAMSGKKTLIVGADMRRPKIFQDFNRSNDQGLSTYLSGIATFEQVVQTTEIQNLFLVSGGPVPPNPSELLLTNKFEEFIKKSLELYDFILIDTPPLALVTDAFVMSKFVDHTVFVMRQNYSPKEFVRSIDEYYRSGKIKNISILLNDIYKSGLGYGYGQGYTYQYGYGYGYGYGNSKKDGSGYYSDN
jgi:capsular exopolysaccharide synthesis family protein